MNKGVSGDFNSMGNESTSSLNLRNRLFVPKNERQNTKTSDQLSDPTRSGFKGKNLRQSKSCVGPKRQFKDLNITKTLVDQAMLITDIFDKVGIASV